MSLRVSDTHRKELLHFLLKKTAAVRSGVKPGELLCVKHCYEGCNAEGFRFCLRREDVFNILKIDYLELRVCPEHSLVLFYNRSSLEKNLADPLNRDLLINLCYPSEGTLNDMIMALQQRFQSEYMPHEVGLFIGYPVKDVDGFMKKLPVTPVHKGDWQVFGNPEESLMRMNLYRAVEASAHHLLQTCHDLQTFFDHISRLQFQPQEATYADNQNHLWQ